MTPNVDRRYAVLTGDVVDSEGMRAAGGPSVAELLGGAVAAAREAFPSAGLSQVDIFRGDSWQCLLDDPAAALRVALFLRAWVRAHGLDRAPYTDTRIAIGLGTVRRLVPERITESEGPAFELSGHALDALAEGVPHRRARLVLRGGTGPLAEAAATVTVLLDALASNWTPKQAWALCGRWRGLTQAEIGERFAAVFGEAIGQVTVGNHLRAAHEEAIGQALEWFDEAANQASEGILS